MAYQHYKVGFHFTNFIPRLSVGIRLTQSGCSSGSGNQIAIVTAHPPAIAAGALIIGDTSRHFKLLSAVTCEREGLRAPHMVALWCEQHVAAERSGVHQATVSIAFSARE